MGQGGNTRLIVDVEPSAHQLRGWLIDPEGEKHPFDGWLEFASTVTAVTSFEPEEGWSGQADHTERRGTT